jgi:D-alanyl-lipoteichoic acid acyltransferase DltB (MBOAT superfamily)
LKTKHTDITAGYIRFADRQAGKQADSRVKQTAGSSQIVVQTKEVMRALAVLETAFVLVVPIWFYWTAFRTTQQTSDKLFYFLRVTRGLDDKTSGLHRSWYTAFCEQFGDPIAAVTTPCRENIGHVYSEPRERLIDLKDAQWHSFRDALPFVMAVAFVHVCGSRLARKWGECQGATSALANQMSSEEAKVHTQASGVRARLWFSLAFSLVLLGFLHEVGTIWVLLATVLNLVLLRALECFKFGKKAARAVLWFVNLSMLLSVQLDVSVWSLVWWSGGLSVKAQEWVAWLDGMKGEMPWRTPFNLLILRLLSFGLDAIDDQACNRDPNTTRDKQVGSIPRNASSNKVHGDDRTGNNILTTPTQCPIKTGHDCSEVAVCEETKIVQEAIDERSCSSNSTPSRSLLYFVYALYPPLYIAGPIMTFNDFSSQVTVTPTPTPTSTKETIVSSGNSDASRCPLGYKPTPPQLTRANPSEPVPTRSPTPTPPSAAALSVAAGVNWEEVRRQGSRTLLSFVVFEVLNHYLYSGVLIQMSFNYHVGGPEAMAAMLKSPNDTSFLVNDKVPMLYYMTDLGTDMAALAMYSYWALIFLWFKFLLIWKSFRLWAMLDGIHTIDNMQACMNMHFTISGFWRSWHRSFNQWLVRYIYLPLGGSRRHKWVNVAVVFTFVAMWHEISLDLLVWGWAFALLMIPEALVQHVATWPSIRTRMARLPPQGNDA